MSTLINVLSKPDKRWAIKHGGGQREGVAWPLLSVLPCLGNTLYVLGTALACTAQCTLRTTHCALHTAHKTLNTPDSTLYTTENATLFEIILQILCYGCHDNNNTVLDAAFVLAV